jgi:nucleolar pre-ribosomal-associated protein 2
LRALVEESKDVPIPVLVQCFQQLSSAASGTDTIDICTSAEHLLKQETDAGQYWSITDSVTKSVQSISENEKLSLMEQILPTSIHQCTAERVMLVRCILSAMHAARKYGAAAPEVGSVSVLVRLLELLNTCFEYDVHQQLVACVTMVLREQVSATSFTDLEHFTNTTFSPTSLHNTLPR